MILTTVAIADPGFARISGYLWPNEPHNLLAWFFYVFYGNTLIIVLMATWDWHKGRLLRSFTIGASCLLAAEFLGSILYFWGPWRDLSLTLVQLSVKYFT
jgi:hypothetical protein